MNLLGPCFVATRDANGKCVVTYNGQPLNPRFDLRRHSPDGFQWGYGGSGPAQLALAICCAALGDDALAEQLYQDYKFHLIAGITVDLWTLPASEVIAWAQDQAKGKEMMNRN